MIAIRLSHAVVNNAQGLRVRGAVKTKIGSANLSAYRKGNHAAALAWSPSTSANRALCAVGALAACVGCIGGVLALFA